MFSKDFFFLFFFSFAGLPVNVLAVRMRHPRKREDQN